LLFFLQGLGILLRLGFSMASFGASWRSCTTGEEDIVSINKSKSSSSSFRAALVFSSSDSITMTLLALADSISLLTAALLAASF
jgi:hypothetical protein